MRSAPAQPGARRLQRPHHLWKEADPDILILKEAKAEYARPKAFEHLVEVAVRSAMLGGRGV
jgi:hypothetical protein